MTSPEEQRFTEIYVSHYAQVHGYVLRRSGVDDARDATAEVFTVAWRRFDELPTDVKVLPWLYGVAAKVLANQRRGARRRGALITRMNGAAVIHEEPVESSDVARPDASLLAALNALSEQDREIVLLNAWEGLPASQLAFRYGISLKAAEKRLTRAKARLARGLRNVERSTVGRHTADDDSGRRR
jgi:RNA polymerase sigma-70 factor (ECF subfamily)